MSISTISRELCCGCGACRAACPAACIAPGADSEGFLYPAVDPWRCIECGRCEGVCPGLNESAPRPPQSAYAAKNPFPQERDASSSGGVFSLLARKVLASGGVVFGAAFEPDWSVSHRAAHNVEELEALRGSKYVQSDTKDSFGQVQKLLHQGREVLFSGTPCQCAGLGNYLRGAGAPTERLLLVDVACHGAPSPGVWQRWLHKRFGKRLFRAPKEIAAIRFRAKPEGWSRYHIQIEAAGGKLLLDQRGRKNSYMRGFLRNLYLRPSCHTCRAKAGRSGSDLTLADYWGIDRWHPGFNDNRGVSLVLANSPKGAEAFASLNAECIETRAQPALERNRAIVQSAKPHRNREKFFSHYPKLWLHLARK